MVRHGDVRKNKVLRSLCSFGWMSWFLVVTHDLVTGKDVLQLPHQCDNWVIGGVKEARQLIKDLEEIIKKHK